MNSIEQKHLEAIDKAEHESHGAWVCDKKDAAVACASITVEIAGEFAEFVLNEGWFKMENDIDEWRNDLAGSRKLSIKELIQLFINQKQ